MSATGRYPIPQILQRRSDTFFFRETTHSKRSNQQKHNYLYHPANHKNLIINVLFNLYPDFIDPEQQERCDSTQRYREPTAAAIKAQWQSCEPGQRNQKTLNSIPIRYNQAFALFPQACIICIRMVGPRRQSSEKRIDVETE